VPRREEYTIYTAVASNTVRTVRTYPTNADYEPQLLRKSRSPRLRCKNTAQLFSQTHDLAPSHALNH
jgi:hypothetical protein